MRNLPEFQKALLSIPALRGAIKEGLRCLRTRDHDYISKKNNVVLTGCIYLDDVLKKSGGRWDYGIGWKVRGRGESVSWIEIHPASSTGNAKDILEKFEWLQKWLASDGESLKKFEKEFVWIASGGSKLRADSPQVKTLAARGIVFSGERYEIGS